VGGLVFAWVPFQAWVKSADTVVKPVPVLPAAWPAGLASAAPGLGEVVALTSVLTARGPAWRVKRAGSDEALWLAMDGGPLPAPDEAAVRTFAQQLYRGTGRLVQVQRLQAAPRRLGIVREAGEREGLWQARFDDALATRVYIDGTSGEFIAARTEAWVLHDFLFRLHVLDFADGEDLNNPLLRVASALSLLFFATGAVLLWRSLRRRRAPRPPPG
jgi:hypothetical protein